MRIDLQLRALAEERKTNFSITTHGYFWLFKFGSHRIYHTNLYDGLEQTMREVA